MPITIDPKPTIDARVAARLSERTKPQAAVLQAKGLHKTYHKAKQEIQVLRGASLKVHRGELLGIVGKSGSGKSTLLHLLGTLDKPDAGEVWFDGGRIDDMPARRRDALRNGRLGMIFQFYHLLPELTTLENVLAPRLITHGVLGWWSHRKKLIAQAKELLDQVGLSHRLTHKPRELSGGEMQRAAIARALVTNPDAVLADEPTGNLDPRTGGEIIALLRNLKESRGLTIVMVTHDPAIAAQADRVVRLVEGKVEVE